MRRGKWVLWAAAVLFMLAQPGSHGAKAPVEEETPHSPENVVETTEEQRLNKGAQVYQTMFFLRCGHSVSRRTDAAEEAVGKTFEETRSYYGLWTIRTLTPDRVEMDREINLYCPMHQVLCLDEAGQLLLCENRYGDGMAICRVFETDTQNIEEEMRQRLIAGEGFDSEEAAVKWLQEMGLMP